MWYTLSKKLTGEDRGDTYDRTAGSTRDIR